MFATTFAAKPHAAAAPGAPATAAGGYRHYRGLLDASEQAAYDTLRGGLARFDDTIALPGCLNQDSLRVVFQGLKLDEPELFYVSELSLVGPASGRGKTKALPAYTMPRATAERILDDMRARANRTARSLDGLGDFEKLIELHAQLASSFVYDASDAIHAHEATGALVYGRGVCDSVSKALKYLCDRCGIPAIVAIGQSNPAAEFPGSALPSNRTMPHAWNLVRMHTAGSDGWYHLDVTHDALMSSECLRYDYFCLSDDDIAVDHALSPDAYYPRCPQSFGYYARAGRFASSKSELTRIARQAQAKGENPFVFQLPRIQGADGQFSQKLMQLVSDDLASSSHAPTRLHMMSNPSQMVFQMTLEGSPA